MGSPKAPRLVGGYVFNHRAFLKALTQSAKVAWNATLISKNSQFLNKNISTAHWS